MDQQEKKEVKFVFPKFLYARTTNNKTLDVSYAPQSLDAIEYIRSDFLEQEQPEVFGTVAFQKGVQEGRRLERNEPVTTCDQLRPVTDCHDLEEAAETKYPTRWKKYPNDGIVRSEEYFDLNAEKRDAFIAGAEWKKAKMMDGAVEGEVVKDISNKLAVTAKNINLDGFRFGDKVKIIIVKEEEQ